jgi:hypothetical protein
MIEASVFWLLYCLFFQYIVLILALFHGQVIDKPKEAMPAHALATGGNVEHEVSPCFNYVKVNYVKLLQVIMIGQVLILVIGTKSHKPSKKNLAQLFLELLCAS